MESIQRRIQAFQIQTEVFLNELPLHYKQEAFPGFLLVVWHAGQQKSVGKH